MYTDFNVFKIGTYSSFKHLKFGFVPFFKTSIDHNYPPKLRTGLFKCVQ